MDAYDLILFLLGLAAAAVVAAGGVLCLIVWVAGGAGSRRTEVCPRPPKS